MRPSDIEPPLPQTADLPRPALGAISLAEALCYAELATAYASVGGDYHFLQRAYGRSLAFLYGWARFSVITTGSIALLAVVFGDYMQQALPLATLAADRGAVLYACAAMVALSALNLRGIRTGALAQNWLTLAEVGGLLLIAGAAAFFAAPAGLPAVTPAAPVPDFGLAMVFVLLTYGGWNEAAYLSAEVRDGGRNMVRALTLSVLLVTALYLLVTWAYWHTLGMDGMAMVEFTAPVFWLFFLLTGVALFVLRRREPARPRPFRVPLFPLLPLASCAGCAYMLWSSLSYVYSQRLGGWNAAWIGVAVLALGVVLLRVLERLRGADGAIDAVPPSESESRRPP